MNWAENIKILRQKMLVTQSELAEILEISFASVNRYENNQYEPTMKVKRKLMRLFVKYDIVKGEAVDEQ